jgi:uncharacterized damage-inducible protein DinB
MTTDDLARLFAHLDWADRRALEMLRATPDADALRRLAHVLAAEEVWLARLEGRAPTQPVWPALDLDACAALVDENRARWSAYLGALTAEALAGEVAYVNSAGQSFRSRLDDILLHVLLHGQYHRGQVALLVRAAGGEPSGTDFIAFVRGVPAAVTPVTPVAPAPPVPRG